MPLSLVVGRHKKLDYLVSVLGSPSWPYSVPLVTPLSGEWQGKGQSITPIPPYPLSFIKKQEMTVKELKVWAVQVAHDPPRSRAKKTDSYGADARSGKFRCYHFVTEIKHRDVGL